MEEADGGVEAGGFAGGAIVMGEEGVEEREQCVKRVQGRSAGALCEVEGGLLGGDEVVEGGEVGLGGIAFEAAELVERSGVHGGLGKM